MMDVVLRLIGWECSVLSTQYKAIVELNKNSALSIWVETNMMNFTLVQKGDQLLGAPLEISANVQKNKFFVDHNKLAINVIGVKSENLIGQVLQIDDGREISPNEH